MYLGSSVGSDRCVKGTAWGGGRAETPPPPPPSNLLGDIDTGLLDAAAGMLDSAMGALDALAALGSVPELSDPTGALTGIVGETGTAITQLGEVGNGMRDLLG